MAREVFELDFANQLDAPPALFDVRSKHAALFGGRNGYFYDRATVLDELRASIENALNKTNDVRRSTRLIGQSAANAVEQAIAANIDYVEPNKTSSEPLSTFRRFGSVIIR